MSYILCCNIIICIIFIALYSKNAYIHLDHYGLYFRLSLLVELFPMVFQYDRLVSRIHHTHRIRLPNCCQHLKRVIRVLAEQQETELDLTYC